MERFLYRALFGFVAATMFAACSGTQPGNVSTGSVAVSRTPLLRMEPPVVPWARLDINAHRDLRSSWMSVAAFKGRLLYVADVSTGDVYVFSYPAGTLAGTLTGFYLPSGLCMDKRDDVFVTEAGNGTIVEFARGATSPMKTLHEKAALVPNACAVDPTTGDLAVMNQGNPFAHQRGGVAIYRKARGRPVRYRAMYHPYCGGYDSNGNLFVDGEHESFQAFELDELAKGGKRLERISVDQSFGLAGGIFWDGTRLAIGDVWGSVIYEFTVDGRQASEVEITPLTNTGQYVWSFFLDGQTVVAPNYTQSGGASNVNVFSYPAGGAPLQTIGNGVVEYPVGVAVTR